MLREISLMVLLGISYGSIFEHSLKFSPLRKGVHRFTTDVAKDAEKLEESLRPESLPSDVDGGQADLLEKLRAALLLKGQPVNGKPLLSMFGLSPPSQDKGKTSGVTLQSYSIANCSTKSADKPTFVIDQLTVGPDPIVMPGVLNFKFNININRDITNLSVALDFRKKVGSVYIKIPCIGEFGSCTYDVCTMLQQVPSCPPQFNKDKIPCHCPFTKGVYNEPGFSAEIEGAVFPPGDYQATANMTYGHAKFAGCYVATFTFA